MDIGSLVQQVTGSGNTQALGQAADDHLDSMEAGEVSQHLQTAADNASRDGENGVAQELQGLIAQHGVNRDALKSAAVAYIRSNPQVLTHFAPSFAQGLLNRII